MRLVIIALLFLAGCSSAPVKTAHVPKYKAGDCVSMEAMTITAKGEWDSSGHMMSSFKILEIIHTDKMNTYMAERLHAQDFYKVRMLSIFEKDRGYYKKETFVIPVEDLDNYRYSGVFWELSENATHGCNSYSEKK